MWIFAAGECEGLIVIVEVFEHLADGADVPEADDKAGDVSGEAKEVKLGIGIVLELGETGAAALA